MSRQEEFTTLDALRGVAALAVMLFHTENLGLASVHAGYLAVDIFFVMSGFVIAHAYAGRMAAGLDFAAFLRRRAIRLFPMLVPGALLGIALWGGHAGMLLLVPDFRGEGNLFPANPPFWSLFYEALFYAAFALFAWRLKTPTLLGIIVLSATVLALAATSPEPFSDYGTSWLFPTEGIARVSLGFAWGLLLHRWWMATPRKPRETPLGWLPLFGFAVLAIAIPADSKLLPLLAVAVLIPALVAWSICWKVPQRAAAGHLAALSYPLYCIHMPLIAWLATGGVATAIVLAILPLAALALERWYERPARRWLARHWRQAETRAGEARPASA